MKRLFSFGGIFLSGIVSAAEPVSVYPGTTVKSSDSATPATVMSPASTDPSNTTSTPLGMPSTLSQPIGRILGAPTPASIAYPAVPVAMPMSGVIAPTVPVGQCTTGECSTGTCAPSCDVPLFPTTLGTGSRARPALDRLVEWFSYQPGPSQLPILVPVPYHAPLRAYFPCRDTGSAQCAGGTCATGSSGTGTAAMHGSGVGAGFAGGFGSRLGSGSSSNAADGNCKDKVCNAPLPKGFGAFARPSGYCPTTGSLGVGCAPIAVPLPASCVGTMGCIGGCKSRGNAFERLLGFFGPSHFGYSESGCRNCGPNGTDPNWQPPTATVPMIMGYTFPTQGQYRFAHPTTHPSLLPNQQTQPLPFAPAMQPQSQPLPVGTVLPVGYQTQSQQRAATLPFTRQ